MAEQRISYTGERIDVGIDVHKETYTVTSVAERLTQRPYSASPLNHSGIVLSYALKEVSHG